MIVRRKVSRPPHLSAVFASRPFLELARFIRHFSRRIHACDPHLRESGTAPPQRTPLLDEKCEYSALQLQCC